MLLELHTGSDTFVRPSVGSWINYGLGSENQNLPGYVTICPTLTHGGANAYGSAFLPADFQGTPIGNASTPSDQARIPFIENFDQTPAELQRIEVDFLREMNTRRRRAAKEDSELEARINSFELAFRMQSAAPHLQNVDDETESTRRMYGLDNDRTRELRSTVLNGTQVRRTWRALCAVYAQL